MRLERKRKVLTAFLTPILFLGCATAIMAQRLIVFDVPNASSMHVVGMNENGSVAGFYWDTNQGKYRGFVRDQNGNITAFDAPDASNTYVGSYASEGVNIFTRTGASINNMGSVVGYFQDASQGEFHGFVRDRNGDVTVFDAPDALGTFAWSINDSGEITGAFAVPRSVVFSGVRFYVRARKGSFTVFDIPLNTSDVSITGINNGGDLAGYCRCPSAARNGFVRDRKGNITYFDANLVRPGFERGTFVEGVNSSGEIAGYFYDFPGPSTAHGFVRDRTGTITAFDAPNALFYTTASSINDSGDVVGGFLDGSQGKPRGFVRDRQGNFTVFDVPGADTLIINNAGDVAGSDALHGFVLFLNR
jgi:uncharacterized membrane protein